MAFRVAGSRDAKVEIGPDMLDELGGVGELVLARRIVLGSGWAVAAQGDHVFDAGGLQSLEHAVNFLAGSGPRRSGEP